MSASQKHVGCPSGKLAYQRRSSAEAAGRRAAERPAKRRAGKRKMMAYLCPDCGFWHLATDNHRR